MRLCVPPGVEPVWYRHEADPITKGADLEATGAVYRVLNEEQPQVVVNLAGESDVDKVERAPRQFERLNVDVPELIAEWSRQNTAKYVHISSQAVFGGNHGRNDHPPYHAASPRAPVNAYGSQKLEAERIAHKLGAVIVRPSFVLGCRQLPHVGRQNPLEAMLDGQRKQVADRWFSPLMAWDAAELIWYAVQFAMPGSILQLGIPQGFSRYEIASLLRKDYYEPVHHGDFPGLAERPENTTYADGKFKRSLETGLYEAVRGREEYQDRITELALFFGMRFDSALLYFAQGFLHHHENVSKDFRAADTSTHAGLLDWYRRTQAYIWELSAYHEDSGFNYAGMVKGIAERLGAAHFAKEQLEDYRVLCLGDGIGDLTLSLHQRGFKPVYHDLLGSETARYAAFRFWRQTGTLLPLHLTGDFRPPMEIHPHGPFDAVVSLDFLEHVPNVTEWTDFIRAALKPGGLFCAQNAFGMGSGPNGSMPMHLAENDRYEKEWDPLLASLNFTQEGSNWYRK